MLAELSASLADCPPLLLEALSAAKAVAPSGFQSAAIRIPGLPQGHGKTVARQAAKDKIPARSGWKIIPSALVLRETATLGGRMTSLIQGRRGPPVAEQAGGYPGHGTEDG
jgi:hypothetical protein